MVERGLRAGDADREETARVLRDQCAAGRLDLDELETRLAAVYAAVTVDALRGLVADLPLARSEAPAEGAKLWWPGICGFHVTRHLASTCREAFDDALRSIVPRMALRGFHLVDDVPPRRLAFVEDRGLRVTVLLLPAEDGGTDLSAFGDAPQAVRRAFATLSD